MWLTAIKRELYASEDMFPPLDGGHVFRLVSDKTGAKEEKIALAAIELGFWPKDPRYVDRACTARRVDTTPEAVFDDIVGLMHGHSEVDYA